MSFIKEIKDKILIFKLEEFYLIEDYAYFWELAIEENDEFKNSLSFMNIIIDCSRLKHVDQTAGEIFIFQNKFEEKTNGKFVYCGLDDKMLKMFNFFASKLAGIKEPKIINYPGLEDAIAALSK